MGEENELEANISEPTLRNVLDSTNLKLQMAKLAGQPALHIVWQPDA